ncbi:MULTISPECIES: DUF3592 domain-containing protein [unclassified Streptomyces]|uniref:DUF3592 domain-containing protein n=1 Tax=unclassified Streptomyces TaxID=2593676 RepID=UPI00342DD21D
MGLMEAVFYILPGIFLVVGVLGVVKTLRRSSRISRVWRHGRTAEARCLRSYTTTSGGGEMSVTTTLHHVYEFRTAEGQVVRFNEASGPSTVIEGDFVTVYYLPEDPSGATAQPPAQGKLAAGTGCLVAFFTVFILFSLGFMGAAHFIFSVTGDVAP